MTKLYCIVWVDAEFPGHWEMLHEHDGPEEARACQDLQSEGIVPKKRLDELMRR